jgi:hypothetical protein
VLSSLDSGKESCFIKLCGSARVQQPEYLRALLVDFYWILFQRLLDMLHALLRACSAFVSIVACLLITMLC